MARRGKSMHRGFKAGQSSSSSSRSDKPKKPQLTHFLCIPLVTASSRSQLEASLQRFQQVIHSKLGGIAAQSTSAFPSRAVRPIGTIHFTLGVMSLKSEEAVDAAVKFLKSLDLRQLPMGVAPQSSQLGNEAAVARKNRVEKSGVLEDDADSSKANEDRPSNALNSLTRAITPPMITESKAIDPAGSVLAISLTSLRSMHAATKTSILYAEPEDSSERLYSLCAKLRSLFESEGYLIPDDRPLKLHATIINTIYAKASGRRQGNRSRGDRAGGSSLGFVVSKSTHATAAAGEAAADVSSANPDSDIHDSERDNQAARDGGSKSDRSEGHGPNARAPIRFDATGILEECKDFIWAKDFPLEKVAICKMGAKKIEGANGEIIGEEYEEIASIPIVL